MIKKAKLMFVLMIVALVVISASALALPNVEQVKINGDVFESGDRLEVERGDTLDFKVKLNSTTNESNVEMEVYLLGYEYNDHNSISDRSHIFDMKAGNTVYKTLSITIPKNADKDHYDVRLRVGSRTGSSVEYTYSIDLTSARHSMTIKDVVFSPESEIKAGRALLATVRVKNDGDKDQDNIRIRVTIPALGVTATEYLDELEAEETVSSEELYLRIPTCTEAGIYNVNVEVTYDEGYETISKETTLRVVEDETCYTAPVQDEKQTEKTIISVGSTSMDIMKGESGVVYPITISNSGSKSKIYSIEVDGTASWGEVKVTPSNTVVIQAGQTSAMYVYVSAIDSASLGEHMFSITVKSDEEVLKQIPLKAYISASEDETTNETTSSVGWEKVKKGLELGLVVLVVLLVLLGLIVGFNKLKGDKEDDDSQTYY
jgi:uncharacterized membrane protein